jgi:GNAT superfamily N-acetyltransferase
MHNHKDEIVFCKSIESDCPLISDLVSDISALGTAPRGAEYYYNMYFNNPVGKGISIIAKHRKKIIAHFGIAPKKYKIDNQEITIGKTMDMFTDSNYQKMGLSSKLLNLAFREAEKDGIYIFYVTPSQFSAPIFLKKFNFEEPFTFREYWYVFDFKKVLDSKKKLPFINAFLSSINRLKNHIVKNKYNLPANISIERKNGFGEEVDAFWNSIKNSYKITLVKDLNYMTWRYISNPADYKIYYLLQNRILIGILILKIIQRFGDTVGVIVDTIYDQQKPEIFEAMIRYSFDSFEANNCVSGLAWGTGEGIQHSIFKKFCYFTYYASFALHKPSYRRILLKQSGRSVLPNLPGYLTSIQNWIFCIGDGNDY